MTLDRLRLTALGADCLVWLMSHGLLPHLLQLRCSFRS